MRRRLDHSWGAVIWVAAVGAIFWIILIVFEPPDEPLPPCTQVIDMPNGYPDVIIRGVGDHTIIENTSGELQVLQFANTCKEDGGAR